MTPCRLVLPGLMGLLVVLAGPVAGAGATPTEDLPRGPRRLPTFVDLELDGFPRPAAEACPPGRPEVHVEPPATISAALASVGPGTTIRVAPGTWVESPDGATALTWLTEDVCLLGALDADGGPAVVLQAAEGQKYGLDLRADRAVLSGFVLRGFAGAVGMWGPEGHTQSGVTIENVRIELDGETRDGIVSFGDNRASPGRPPTLDGLLVLDVTIAGADLGVSCNAGPCAHWWIEATDVSGRRAGATAGDEAALSGSSGSDGIAIEEGRQIVILDSVVRAADADAIDLKAHDAVIMAVRALDAGRNGIKLWHGGDVLDSVVDGSGADAALVGDGAGRYRYAHLLVTHHGEAGLGSYVGWWAYDTGAPVSVEIIDSIFADNAGGGLYLPAGAALALRHDLFGDRDALLLEMGGRSWSTGELADLEASGLGQGNLIGEPLLCEGWMPAADSPLIDAGEPVPGLNRDLWGSPRSSGAAPDIGPVERPARGPGEPQSECAGGDPQNNSS